MAKRFIRLKEHQPSKSGSWTPSEDYRDRTDGSLPETSFEYHTLPGGFLDTGTEHSDDLPSVFIIGGSFVESSFSTEKQRFPAQLDAMLRTHNVVNAGYSGTTTLQAVLLILGKIPIYAKRNDTILLFIAKSDANALILDGGYWNNSKAYSPIVPIDFESAWESSGEELESLLKAVSTFAKGIGLNLLIATSPHRNGDFSSDKWLRLAYRRNRAVYEKRVEMRDYLDTQVREVIPGLEVPFLDLSAMFTNRDELFYDEMHLNEHGQKEVSEAVLQFLEENL